MVLVITFSPFVEWAGGKLAGPWPDAHGEVLVVLGGSMQSEGILGYSSYLRSQYAIMAYREGGFRTVVVSGGGAGEADAMKFFLEGHGVPRDAVLAETSSTSTRENVQYTVGLLQNLPGRKVLMTSDFHMFRAHRVFRKMGVEMIPRPVPDVRKRGSRWTGRWPAFLDLVVESGKIAYYYSRGWI